jgi:hypothetical protein
MKRFFLIIAVLIFLFLANSVFSETYTPIQISLVPGLALPFGSNSALCLGPIGNISGRVDLLQVAGVFNMAGESIEGVQAAGVFNMAGDIDGVQVGLVNLAGKVRGVQVGLINFSSNGVFDPEIDLEPDTGFLRTSLKTGNSFLFARYAVAAPKDELFSTWNRALVSAGLGTRIGDLKSLYLDLSVLASQAVGSDPGLFVQCMTWNSGHTPKEVLAPWPTLEAGLLL